MTRVGDYVIILGKIEFYSDAKIRKGGSTLKIRTRDRFQGMWYGWKHGIPVDGLTGLHTRAYFVKEIWPKALSRVTRFQYSLSVVEIDLDDLTSINNTKGHLAGDRALRRLANIVKELIRSSDIMVRWGGDEFMLLLPGSKITQARIVVDKIRIKLREEGLDASFGVAELNKGASFHGLFSQADDELYEEKKRKHEEESLRLLNKTFPE